MALNLAVDALKQGTSINSNIISRETEIYALKKCSLRIMYAVKTFNIYALQMFKNMIKKKKKMAF